MNLRRRRARTEPVYAVYVHPSKYRQTKRELRRDPQLRDKVVVHRSALVKPGEVLGVDEVALRRETFTEKFETDWAE